MPLHHIMTYHDATAMIAPSHMRHLASHCMHHLSIRTEAERAVAASPGLYGRIWYGQGLTYDEAYPML